MKLLYVMLIVCVAGCRSNQGCAPLAPPSFLNGNTVTGGAQNDKTLPLVTVFNVPDLAGSILAAKSGDASAATRVANFYALTVNDTSKALKYYKLAAKFGGKEERDTLNSYISVLRED